RGRDAVTDLSDGDGRPLAVDGAPFAQTKALVDCVEVGCGPQLRLPLEALRGTLSGLGVDRCVVALGEPGFEVAVELLEGQQLVAVFYLGFELLLDRAIEALDDPA